MTWASCMSVEGKVKLARRPLRWAAIQRDRTRAVQKRWAKLGALLSNRLPNNSEMSWITVRRPCSLARECDHCISTVDAGHAGELVPMGSALIPQSRIESYERSEANLARQAYLAILEHETIVNALLTQDPDEG